VALSERVRCTLLRLHRPDPRTKLNSLQNGAALLSALLANPRLLRTPGFDERCCVVAIAIAVNHVVAVTECCSVPCLASRELKCHCTESRVHHSSSTETLLVSFTGTKSEAKACMLHFLKVHLLMQDRPTPAFYTMHFSHTVPVCIVARLRLAHHPSRIFIAPLLPALTQTAGSPGNNANSLRRVHSLELHDLPPRPHLLSALIRHLIVAIQCYHGYSNRRRLHGLIAISQHCFWPGIAAPALT
jgi:hypothetical protein